MQKSSLASSSIGWAQAPVAPRLVRNQTSALDPMTIDGAEAINELDAFRASGAAAGTPVATDAEESPLASAHGIVLALLLGAAVWAGVLHFLL